MSIANDRPRARVGFIVGPTGTGKSALAIEIAARLGGEIVNADSRLFYRGLDIGTAKPGPAERTRVPHHLIDICAPDQTLDAARFATLAADVITEIVNRGHYPLVVGGSGLYLRALQYGLCASPPAAPELRKQLRRRAAEASPEALHRELESVDAAAAARIGSRDLTRIVRALEVFELTGEPLSARQQRHGFADRRYDSITVGLAMERQALYARIDARFDAMLAAGLADEVRRLLERGYAPDRPPLSTIGYREIAASLRGELTLAEAAAAVRRETRRLAKRQLTWFRHDPEIIWLDARHGGPQALKLFAEFFNARRDEPRVTRHDASC